MKQIRELKEWSKNLSEKEAEEITAEFNRQFSAFVNLYNTVNNLNLTTEEAYRHLGLHREFIDARKKIREKAIKNTLVSCVLPPIDINDLAFSFDVNPLKCLIHPSTTK